MTSELNTKRPRHTLKIEVSVGMPPVLLGNNPADIPAIRDAFRQLFDFAALHLGDSEARQLVREVARRKSGRKKGKRLDPDRDAWLLKVYDEAGGWIAKAVNDKPDLPATIEALPADIARRAYDLSRSGSKDVPENIGACPDTIEKHLRRLLDDRYAREDAAKRTREAEQRYIWEMWGKWGAEPPPSVLTKGASEGHK